MFGEQGQISYRSNILSISNANPCVITTDNTLGYRTNDMVRLTNLNRAIPTPHGSDQLNNNRYEIVRNGIDSFFIRYPVTHLPVDSTNFVPYVAGGYCNKIGQKFFYHASEADETEDMENSDEDYDEDQTLEG